MRGSHRAEPAIVSGLLDGFEHASLQTIREKPEHTRSMLAVCILGELSRTEIESKIEMILQPLSKDADVDVFAVLEKNASSYVNKDTRPTDPNCNAEPTQEDLEQQLSPFWKKGIFVEHQHLINLDRAVWPVYGDEKKSGDPSIRFDSHVSQWRYMRACAELVEERENEIGRRYAAIIKLRDDSIGVQPLELAPVMKAVQVKNCCKWQGYNDKVMIVPRNYMLKTLGAAWEVANLADRGDAGMMQLVNQVKNPEQMLKVSLQAFRVPVDEVSADALPLVDGRCDSALSASEKQFCVVPRWKDCRPASASAAYQTCDPRHFPASIDKTDPERGISCQRYEQSDTKHSGMFYCT